MISLIGQRTFLRLNCTVRFSCDSPPCQLKTVRLCTVLNLLGVWVSMRVRTEEKKREIVEIAAQLFEELGYDRTSMSLISQRVGGSKATLYGYFKSKEELLLASLYLDISSNSERMLDTMLRTRTLRDGLIELGVLYLERRLSPRPISNVRIVATQPEELGIGKEFYANILRDRKSTR